MFILLGMYFSPQVVYRLRWPAVIISFLLWLGSPFLGYATGLSMETFNEEGLNKSASIRHQPGLARELTPDWSTICIYVFAAVATVIFVLDFVTFLRQTPPTRGTTWR